MRFYVFFIVFLSAWISFYFVCNIFFFFYFAFYQLDPDRSLFDQSIELPYDPEWEFPRENITIMRQVGSGAFGLVSLANARGIYALSPRDKDTVAIRRRAQLRLHKRVPKPLLNCFFNDDLCDQDIPVAVKSLKGKIIFLYYW